MNAKPESSLRKLLHNYSWPIAVFVTLIVVLALAAQYFEGRRHATPEEELALALHAFRSGYDQTALSILTPLADEGNPKAQYWLADIYENGEGVKPQAAKAMGLLEKSAAQGFAPAQRRLGELYMSGDQTLQDFSQARNWLGKAADAGDVEAARSLGQLFALGLGVARDPATAYAWYEIAALRGDGLAQHLRDELLKSMTPDEMAAGERTAKQMQARIKPKPP